MSESKIIAETKDIATCNKIDTLNECLFYFIINFYNMATTKTIKLINAWNITYNGIRKGETVNIAPEYLTKYTRKGFVKHEDYFKKIEAKNEADRQLKIKEEKERKKRLKEQQKRDAEQKKLDDEAEAKRLEAEAEEDDEDIDDEDEDESELDDPEKEDDDFGEDEEDEEEAVKKEDAEGEEDESEEDEEDETEVEEISIDLENGTKKQFAKFCADHWIKVEWRNAGDYKKAIEDFIAEQNK